MDRDPQWGREKFFRGRKVDEIMSYRIAKSGKPYTIAEDLIAPAAQDIAAIMFGEKEMQQISQIPLSDTTVNRRIFEMAENVENEIIMRIRKSKFFSLQLDESTDCQNAAQLICFAKYGYKNEVVDDFLFCKELQRTTGEEIFKSVNSYITGNNISWENCVGVCSDGARAMVGKHSGLLARIKEVSPNVTWVHCMIHREALVSKNMPPNLMSVLDTEVKIINFIKARPLNSRIFAHIYKEMGSEHQHLFLHTEVRWLLRGRVLTRLFELKEEVFVFLNDNDKDKKFTNFLTDEEWLCRLAYLSDIFLKLNELNLSLQGEQLNILVANDKIKAFTKKIDLWCSYCKENNFAAFPTLECFVIENKFKVIQSIVKDITSSLDRFKMSI
ncbi:zinc finger BED domain-containing protein 5-like [Onthophagus taurus]|uniref:zinc finger BED domain-containing protein 5-like n=1 Tax=Onthophagus taurus TaxID=166361 RepID=UPI0039BEBEFD